MQAIVDFIHELTFESLPEQVVTQASICLLDTLGVAAAGHATKLSSIMETFVSEQMAGSVPLLFSEQTASLTGASLFGASLIDSIDAHDGQVLTKGHVGAAIVPSLLAMVSDQLHKDREVTGKELVTCLVIGYEVATRAGIALHATATDYHTSGAWNSIGVAAMMARLLGLGSSQTREALGAAEFHGPRSQMMRCIDYPTMVKDGSGWGALVGMSSALLAQAGFTGAPAITVDAKASSNTSEQAEVVQRTWHDIAQRWYIQEQYFKAYPVCRWAQPAVEAIREIQAKHQLDYRQVAQIHIVSFHEAKRLHVLKPINTEQAQYSLPFSVASAMMEDGVSVEAVAETKDGLFHPARQALSCKVIISEAAEYNDRFPEERWAHAIVELQDGQRFQSSSCIARGNPENPLSNEEIKDKFCRLSQNRLSADRQQEVIQACLSMSQLDHIKLTQFLQELSEV